MWTTLLGLVAAPLAATAPVSSSTAPSAITPLAELAGQPLGTSTGMAPRFARLQDATAETLPSRPDEVVV